MKHHRIINKKEHQKRFDQHKKDLQKLKYVIKEKSQNTFQDEFYESMAFSNLVNLYNKDTEIHSFVFFLEHNFVLIEIDNFSFSKLKYDTGVDVIMDIVKAYYNRKNTKSLLLSKVHKTRFSDDDFKNQVKRYEMLHSTYYEVNHIYKYKNKDRMVATEVDINDLDIEFTLNQKKDKAIDYLKEKGFKQHIETVKELCRYNITGFVSQQNIVKSIDELISNLKSNKYE